MKKTLLATLLLVSPSVLAAPYVGMQYGMGKLQHDYRTHFTADNVTVSPDETNSDFGAFVGYQFNQSIALELGYNQIKSEAEIGKYMGIVAFQNMDFYHEREWQAQLKTKQITLKPVYVYALTDNLAVKAAVGLTYTQYHYSSSSVDEYEGVANDELESELVRAGGGSDKQSAWGGMASLGLEYQVFPAIFLGVAAEYQKDSVASKEQLLFSARYQF